MESYKITQASRGITLRAFRGMPRRDDILDEMWSIWSFQERVGSSTTPRYLNLKALLRVPLTSLDTKLFSFGKPLMGSYQHNLGFKVVQKEIVTIKLTYDTTQVSSQTRFNISNRVAAVEKQSVIRIQLNVTVHYY